MFNEVIVSASIVGKEETNAAAILQLQNDFLHLRNHFGSQIIMYILARGEGLRAVKRSTYLASPALRRKRKEENSLLDWTTIIILY